MKKAFTLIELLVSLSILLILAGILIINPGKGTEEYQIINAAHLVSADIERAKNSALSAKEFNGAIPAGGWGIHIEKDKSCYLIFVDVNSNKAYDAGGEEVCNANSTGSPERFERIFFPQTVSVSEIAVNGAGVLALDAVFLPPRPTVYLNTAGENAVIILKSGPLGTRKGVGINSVGHVSAQ